MSLFPQPYWEVQSQGHDLTCDMHMHNMDMDMDMDMDMNMDMDMRMHVDVDGWSSNGH